MEHLSALPQLESLDLTGQSDKDAGLRRLGKLDRLQRLNLAFCEGVTGEGFESLPATRCPVRTRDLQGLQLSRAGLSSLSELGQLRYLDLAATNITDAELQHVAVLGELEMLSLAFTEVTEVGMQTLRELPKLKSLSHCTTRE